MIRPVALPLQGALLALLLALLLARASGAAPASTTAAELSASDTAASAELRQSWAADPTTDTPPFPSRRLLT
ncbi:MAG: hypothetical protein ACK52U_04200 [Synechococcaceae cyanobacterium]